MYKDGILTIKDWDKGMESHPIYGFGMLKNVEVFENKGLVKIKKQMIDRDGVLPISINDVPFAEVYDNYGNIYSMTSTVFKKNGDTYGFPLTQGWDLAYYKDYVWIRDGVKLHAYGPVNNAPQMFQNLSTAFNDTHYGKLIVGQDSFLYTTNGNAIAKIEVTASGTPAVAPTLSITLDALDLPDNQYAVAIEEYGTNLVIGTHAGASYSERGNYPTARLYPWNRQAGTLGNPGLADLPVIFNENGINAVIQHANKLFVSAGTRGNIYVTDSTNYVKIATLPYATLGTNYQATVYPNAMTISSRGTLLVGLSVENGDYSHAGVYEIDINDSNYPVSLLTPSADIDGPTTIGFVKQKDFEKLYIGWGRYSVNRIDVSTNNVFTGNVAIETPLYKVGNFHKKKTFTQLEFQLAEPLVSGQSLTFSYRKNTQDNYTAIATHSFATLGAVTSFEMPAPIADCEYLQIKIEMSQEDTTPITNNIYLLQVTLR